MAKKWRWGRNGALIGLAIFLADYFLMWRGELYLPWVGNEAIAYNIGKMLSVIGIPALIGFVSGALADRRDKKVTKNATRP
jgi:hypothetical protein